ncbi:uncharacterized protein LOC118601575 isoform X3 [Rousettus aegyptiacus]|uniref:uncharacterized protein LOC118601575 isoform X3 n=1 Tax=Rousettus aegyptiacus TaxID=9407 RepID=UPI00168D199E|nr:uncharacterized protein LOC118601575 isoform X3 [Rousettus aegyptiacus]
MWWPEPCERGNAPSPGTRDGGADLRLRMSLRLPPRRERSPGDAPCGGCVRPEESCELATKGTHVCDGNSWADQYRGFFEEKSASAVPSPFTVGVRHRRTNPIPATFSEL